MSATHDEEIDTTTPVHAPVDEADDVDDTDDTEEDDEEDEEPA